VRPCEVEPEPLAAEVEVELLRLLLPLAFDEGFEEEGVDEVGTCTDSRGGISSESESAVGFFDREEVEAAGFPFEAEV